MSKKSKPAKKKNVVSSNAPQTDKMFNVIGLQIMEGDYAAAVTTCERLLNFLPAHAPQRVEALSQLGTTQALLQHYAQSYAAFTEALEIAPDDPELLYNRGLSGQLTMRFGQSFKDFTRAVELNKTPALSRQFAKELRRSRRIAARSIRQRGRGFTLDQLIEQEDLFMRGLALIDARQWDEAEQVFQASIAMADSLPQPWGNLGTCFLMQERYDEAEAAWKRALVINRRYAIAKNNLRLLPQYRLTGPPEIIGSHDPFEGRKIKQEITIVPK